MQAINGVKHCPRCDTEKAVDAFGKNKSKKDGFQTNCRECTAAIGIRYRQENKDMLAEKNSRWKQKNKEHLKEYNRRYREDNKEIERARDRRYYHNNKEKMNERDRHRRDRLTDNYVKDRVIQSLPLTKDEKKALRKAIPESLIEAQRISLKIKRLIWGSKQ